MIPFITFPFVGYSYSQCGTGVLRIQPSSSNYYLFCWVWFIFYTIRLLAFINSLILILGVSLDATLVYISKFYYLQKIGGVYKLASSILSASLDIERFFMHSLSFWYTVFVLLEKGLVLEYWDDKSILQFEDMLPLFIA